MNLLKCILLSGIVFGNVYGTCLESMVADASQKCLSRQCTVKTGVFSTGAFLAGASAVGLLWYYRGSPSQA